MLVNGRMIGILALLIFLSNCSISEQKTSNEKTCVINYQEMSAQEKELTRLREKYRTKFLIAVGQDTSREVAMKKALTTLGQQIQSRVVSQTNLFTSSYMQQVGDEVEKAWIEENSINTDINSAVELIGAEIIQDISIGCERHLMLKLAKSRVPAILERIKQENIAKRKKLLTLSIDYEYAPTENDTFKSFGNDSTLQSDDLYRIIFTASHNAYIYVFQFDAAHEIFRLFPRGEFENEDIKNVNPVRAGEKYFLPSSQFTYALDNQLGKESIYVIVNQRADPLLEKHYQKLKHLESSIEERAQQRKEVEKVFQWRGPKRKLIKHSTAKSEKIELCDGCVYQMDFQHVSR